ncbi:S8 family serine peptidase [Myxococcota bacterium]|nr:S8 family serine peptidase [Myxococcota bacterium]
MYADFYLLRGVDDLKATRSKLQAQAGFKRFLSPYISSFGQTLIATDRIRVQFDTALSPADAEKRIMALGAVRAKLVHPARGLWDVFAPSVLQTVELSAKMHESGTMLWATPDFIYKHAKHWVPNDPYYDQQWHLTHVAASGGWDYGRGSADVKIAIIDSGVDLTHEDLAGKLLSPRDALNGDSDPTPDYYDGHGTCCAGIAAATTDNSKGVAGLCPDCSVIPIRIMSESGYGSYTADSDAFYWAVDHGAHILSNSWGTVTAAPISYNMQAAINAAADDAREGAGALILFAAGNDGRANESYELASHRSVMSIGATGRGDSRESYSNYGAELDVMAPAASVTVDMTGSKGYNPEMMYSDYNDTDYTGGFSGTSAACPAAAGVAGMIFSADTTFTRAQVMSIMTATADQIGSTSYGTDGHNNYYGYGRLNLYRAMQMASGGEVCQPVAEDCANGLDDDCDVLIDDADPSCSPDETEVGASCTQDFQCGGDSGFCIPAASEFPAGYCSMPCTSSCPGDGICMDTGDYSLCFDGCNSNTDCRSGYSCSNFGGGNMCYPDCNVGGCENGEICDQESGICYHDGPSAPGGACTSDLDCAHDGWCYTDMPDGNCLVNCGSSADCGDAAVCMSFGSSGSFCLASCMRNTDCRDGYSCSPDGSCWMSCRSSEDCNGQICNEYGLCGNDEPPITDGGTDPTDPADCTCDATWDCDADCACDPECQCDCDLTYSCDANCDCDPECEDDGCFSSALLPSQRGTHLAPFSLALALLGLTVLRRRRD